MSIVIKPENVFMSFMIFERGVYLSRGHQKQKRKQRERVGSNQFSNFSP